VCACVFSDFYTISLLHFNFSFSKHTRSLLCPCVLGVCASSWHSFWLLFKLHQNHRLVCVKFVSWHKFCSFSASQSSPFFCVFSASKFLAQLFAAFQTPKSASCVCVCVCANSWQLLMLLNYKTIIFCVFCVYANSSHNLHFNFPRIMIIIFCGYAIPQYNLLSKLPKIIIPSSSSSFCV
jgi:hypothetical protein